MYSKSKMKLNMYIKNNLLLQANTYLTIYIFVLFENFFELLKTIRPTIRAINIEISPFSLPSSFLCNVVVLRGCTQTPTLQEKDKKGKGSRR